MSWIDDDIRGSRSGLTNWVDCRGTTIRGLPSISDNDGDAKSLVFIGAGCPILRVLCEGWETTKARTLHVKLISCAARTRREPRPSGHRKPRFFQKWLLVPDNRLHAPFAHQAGCPILRVLCEGWETTKARTRKELWPSGHGNSSNSSEGLEPRSAGQVFVKPPNSGSLPNSIHGLHLAPQSGLR